MICDGIAGRLLSCRGGDAEAFGLITIASTRNVESSLDATEGALERVDELRLGVVLLEDDTDFCLAGVSGVAAGVGNTIGGKPRGSTGDSISSGLGAAAAGMDSEGFLSEHLEAALDLCVTAPVKLKKSFSSAVQYPEVVDPGVGMSSPILETEEDEEYPNEGTGESGSSSGSPLFGVLVEVRRNGTAGVSSSERDEETDMDRLVLR